MQSIPSLHRRIRQLQKTDLLPGVIESFTVIRHPPEGFSSEPYTVGLIKLQNGKRVCAQLTTDGLAPEIGASVAPCMRRIRTLDNGLFVNDLKYRVTAPKPVHSHAIHAYVLAITGPSGVGKTTIARSLLSLFSAYAEQVPILTTRAPKKGESEPYRYVSEAQFEALIARGEIISHTEMSSASELRHYGYRKADIEAIWKKGKLPIVVTDINLLKGLSASLGRRAILSCGLLPPGNSHRHMLSALLHRLRSRGRETELQIKERLEVAKLDLQAYDAHPHLFDHLLVNDKLEVCLETIGDLVKRPQD